MLEVNLLGTPEVSTDGSPIRVDTRKAIALLSYLAVEGSASRDTLANLFWSESSSERARATLRRTLSALRSAAGPEILDADQHRVTITDHATVDVWSFEDSIRATASHEHDHTEVCGDCIPHLQRVSEAYRGDFLEGFSVRDSPEFEDWVRTAGESFRLRAGEAFRRLAMAHAGAGDYQAAIDAAGRWISLDPLHEPAYRLLMLLKAWAGDRPGAIEAFQRCVAVLDQELGVPPLEETAELHAAILDEDLPPAPGPRRRISPEAIGSAGSKDLIDREEELSFLNRVLASVPVRGQVVRLTGASWMGKTRLIEEFIGSLPTDEAVTVIGRASRSEQNLPYGVVVEVVRGLLPHFTESDIPEWVLTEVSRLVPELGRRNHGPSPPDHFGELRLFNAVETLLRDLSGNRVLVVAIDDVQWLDPASASLLSYLSTRISPRPILLLMAHRSDEDLAEPLVDLLAAPDHEIELEPLTIDQLTAVTGDKSTARSMAEQTGGIPFLVAEYLADDGIPGDESPGVMRYMEARFRDLSELARQVLAAAAVLSGSCDAGLLREVSGRGEEELVDAVEELVAAGLLRELPNSERLSFTLESLEGLTYDSTSLIRRRLLHRRAATALADRPRADTDPRVAAAVAAQHQAAGSKEAANWYRRAGDLALELYAYTEATDFYEKAIALGSPDVARLRIRLGEVAIATGDYRSALHHLNSAAGQSQSADLGVAEHRLGDVQRLLGRFDLAEEHFTRASETHPAPASLYADWALLRSRTGDSSGALELAQLSLQLAEETNDDGQLSRAHNILGVVASDNDTALESLDEALRLAGTNEQLRMAALNNRAHLLSKSGDLDEAVALVEEAIAIAKRTGHRHREAALRNHLADLHHLAGRKEEAEQALTTAVGLFAGVGAGDWEPEVWLLRQW
ncbi:MAG: tetratricopeptide repeat protein [Actinomycetota bacterium]